MAIRHYTFAYRCGSSDWDINGQKHFRRWSGLAGSVIRWYILWFSWHGLHTSVFAGNTYLFWNNTPLEAHKGKNVGSNSSMDAFWDVGLDKNWRCHIVSDWQSHQEPRLFFHGKFSLDDCLWYYRNTCRYWFGSSWLEKNFKASKD